MQGTRYRVAGDRLQATRCKGAVQGAGHTGARQRVGAMLQHPRPISAVISDAAVHQIWQGTGCWVQSVGVQGCTDATGTRVTGGEGGGWRVQGAECHTDGTLSACATSSADI